MKKTVKTFIQIIVLAFVFTIAYFILSATHVSAASYYISPTGSDSNSGSISSPWANWKHACQYLSPGDTLYARGGTYNDQLVGNYWTVSGTQNAPITFAAYPGETPIFEGLGYQVDFMNVQSQKWLIFDGLRIQNYNVSGIWLGNNGSSDVTTYTQNVIIRNCKFYNIGDTPFNDHGVYISWGASNITIYNNLMKNIEGGCVHMYHIPGGSNYLIYNNIFEDSYWGVIVDEGHNDVKIYNNTFYNNSRNIQVSTYENHISTNIQIKNNISYSSSGVGLYVDPAVTSQVTEDYNLWYDTTTTAPIYWGGVYMTIEQLRANTTNGDHSIRATPQFINPGADIFEVSGNCGSIDAGTDLTDYVPTDYAGYGRPFGLAWDLGAYEKETWYSKSDFASGVKNLGQYNTGTVTAEFDLIPDTSVNATVGYADTSTTVTDFTSLPMIIAMDTTQGYFTVRNGANYSCLSQVYYNNNTLYHFKLIANFSNNTYTVYVTPGNGSPIMIAQNYAFRSDAPATNDLGKISIKSDTSYAVKIENHVVTNADSSWYSKSAFIDGVRGLGTNNTGNRTLEFDLTPLNLGSVNSATLGLADTSTEINAWINMPMIIAMDKTHGYFTVRNGSTYSCLTQVAYSNNTSYHFKIVSDFANRKYTVYVTPSGGTQTTIASNYSFRTDSPNMNDLGKMSLKSDSNDAFKIQNVTVY